MGFAFHERYPALTGCGLGVAVFRLGVGYVCTVCGFYLRVPVRVCVCVSACPRELDTIGECWLGGLVHRKREQNPVKCFDLMSPIRVAFKSGIDWVWVGVYSAWVWTVCGSTGRSDIELRQSTEAGRVLWRCSCRSMRRITSITLRRY